MNNEEFKAARKELGLSVKKLGIIINTNPVAIRRWESPNENTYSRSPNPVACRVMKWILEDNFRPPEWPN